MTDTSEQAVYYQYPGEAQPRRGGGCGCWVAGLTTGLIVAVMVGIALFLPPFNLGERIFGTQYAVLDAQNNAVAVDGLTFIVNPADPGETFGVALASTPIEAFSGSLPSNLTLQSAVYDLSTTGTVPQEVTMTLAVPGSVSNRDLLDLYAWDGNDWSFVPSHFTADNQVRARFETVPQSLALFQAAPAAPIVLTKLDVGQALPGNIGELSSIIAPAGMQPALPTSVNRTLVGNPSGGFDLGARYLVMPYVRNFNDPRATDPETVASLINNSQLRNEHIQELTAFAVAGRYDGLLIDYRDVPVEERDNFSRFIRDLAENLHEVNLTLGVAVPQAENVDGVWETGAYDWRALGLAADFIEIGLPLNPSAYTPGADQLVEAMLRWAVGEVSRYKIIADLSAKSLREVLATGDFTPIAYDEALSALGNVKLDVTENDAGNVLPGSEIRLSLDGFDAVPGVDTTVQAPFINYYEADGINVSSRMWLTTGDTLRFRMDRLSAFAIGGVAFNDLLEAGIANDVPETILNYKIQLPEDISSAELVLNWRIESDEGRVMEFTTGFRDEIVVTLDAPDGNYAVNVDVVGGEISSARGGAAVALFAPTATPTPLPTVTPTPVPTATPTLVPIVPTEVPAAANSAPAAANFPSGGAANVPGAGSIALGAFEYGGHVTGPGDGRAVNAARSAGMTWMKVQLRWGVGGGTEQAQAFISSARANGFKILLGVVGDPGQLAAGGGDYIRQFAAFSGSVAALGPDAIEVWNEPNLSREWPEGQISGANYAALLRETYTAIKGANPSVMVISGAPAPTGAEAAFPGRVVNDDNFLRQMVEAGAMGFMDCVGMHYNEGIVGPRQTSGDPRDNYYTRYLPTLLDVYWGITGGQKPICITELGYITPEGFGPLPDFFSWGQNVTVAQQAAWLADAAAYASNTGRVRLMIVWNVDFTNYGADPMAGYAIIRPDGSCPACSALAGAR